MFFFTCTAVPSLNFASSCTKKIPTSSRVVVCGQWLLAYHMQERAPRSNGHSATWYRSTLQPSRGSEMHHLCTCRVRGSFNEILRDTDGAEYLLVWRPTTCSTRTTQQPGHTNTKEWIDVPKLLESASGGVCEWATSGEMKRARAARERRRADEIPVTRSDVDTHRRPSSTCAPQSPPLLPRKAVISVACCISRARS